MASLKLNSIIVIVLVGLVLFQLSQTVESCKNRTAVAQRQIQDLLNRYPDLFKEVFTNTATNTNVPSTNTNVPTGTGK